MLRGPAQSFGLGHPLGTPPRHPRTLANFPGEEEGGEPGAPDWWEVGLRLTPHTATRGRLEPTVGLPGLCKGSQGPSDSPEVDPLSQQGQLTGVPAPFLLVEPLLPSMCPAPGPVYPFLNL